MPQRVGRTVEMRSRKIGVRGLMTMKQVTAEMRRIYVEARHGTFDGGWPACGTAMRCLERLRFSLAAGPVEERLTRIEEHLSLRGQRGPGAGNGNTRDDDDGFDEEDNDRDERGGIYDPEARLQ